IGSDVTDEEVSAAVEYQALVVSAKNIAVAPPWFQTAMTHINKQFDHIDTEISIQTNRLNQSIEELKTSVNGLQDSIVGLQDKVHEVKTTAEALCGMNSLQLKRYHQKYCPGQPDVDGRLDDNVHIPEVLRAIGSTAC
ncbi:hypothetical protein CVT25_011783, partial [Psilocybe cyanescens]